MYARKSTEDDDRQILSIQAQLAELQEYSAKEKFYTRGLTSGGKPREVQNIVALAGSLFCGPIENRTRDCAMRMHRYTTYL